MAEQPRGKRWRERYLPLVREDLRATYMRDLHKWLLVAPLVGVAAGLTITAVAQLILHWMWPPLLAFYLRHPWAMVPGVTLGCAVAGFIMQRWTPDPNQHSTEEVIAAYHERRGAISMRPFLPKLLAAVATVGSGGSAALEGPSIYGGAAVGQWVWTRLERVRRLRLTPRDRRVLLVCGAAAGMSAVFRAPLTGIVFALEMPYKDDLAHEALLPSLIASVVSYMTLGAFLGGAPLFNFSGAGSGYGMRDLLLSLLLGVGIGLIAMFYVITFRRLRALVVGWGAPHWAKLALGGALTGLTGWAFVRAFPGNLVPLGANYEAVGILLDTAHGPGELLAFVAAKLLATAFTLGAGGVSAMFVPVFLCGGALGTVFGQLLVPGRPVALYAAVGMACFISAAYKAPLAAVVFVAEATGGHAFIVPALLGAAAAYAVSGDSSVSKDQRVREEGEPSTVDKLEPAPEGTRLC